MKKYFVPACVCISLVLPASLFAADAVDKAESLKTYEEKISYTMGYEMGNYAHSMSADIQQEAMQAGIADAFAGGDAKLTTEQMAAVKQEFAQKMQAAQQKKLEEVKAKNLAAGKAFLEKNKTKEGVKVTASGLQYEMVVEGKGAKATASDTVTVHYTGTLIDGKEFDSTVKRGKPVEFRVDQVIPGWTEALQMMSAGSKMRLVIPPELAYGEQGAPPVIEPNSVLVFDVELVGIKKAEKKPEEKAEKKAAAKKEKESLGEKVEKAVKKVEKAMDDVHAAAKK